MYLRLLLAAAALSVAAPAASTPTEDFQRLLDEHYAWLLRENPTYATALGVRDHDERLPDLSPEARERQVAQARTFLQRVDAISDDQLSPADRVTRAILRRGLSEQIEGWQFGQRDIAHVR